MPETQESMRKDVINTLIEYIKEKSADFVKSKLSPKKAELLIALAPQYFRTIPLDDFTSRSLDELYGILSIHFELMQYRQPGECKVQIFNPRLDQEGWQSTHTIMQLVYDDMPFLVDSIRVELNRLGLTPHLTINAGGIKVIRNDEGKLIQILPRGSKEQAPTEAIMHVELDRQTDSKTLESIKENTQQILKDVTVVVKDWDKMRKQLLKAIEELDQLEKVHASLSPEDIEESKAFLRWLLDDHFTFLGYRAYETIGEGEKMALRLIPHTGLGVLRDESASKVIRYFNELPPKALKLVKSKNVLIISKTNTKATVHRSGYTDYIGVKQFDTAGNIIGEKRFIGLYTSEAYSSDPLQIPFLRLKVKTVLEKSGFPPTGHSARALRNILATLPRDDLFQASVDELYELAIGILHLQERRRIRLFVRKDAYGRYFSCLIYVPRETFNTELLYKMRDILKKAFAGTEVTFTTHFSESVLARIHFVVRVDPKKPISYDVKAIENQLVDIGRSWYEDLRNELLERFGEENGNELINRYLRAFPAGYREIYSPKEAIYDIRFMEKLTSEQDLEMSFYRPVGGTSSLIRFKLFHLTSTIPLSDALPMLENMGLRVIGEQPYEIVTQEQKTIWINDFSMEYGENSQLDVGGNRENFQNAFYRIWNGEVENDGFNRLVLKAQFNWHEITMFRGYAKYLRQVGFTFSQQYIEETLGANPSVALLLLNLFKLRFDPKVQERNPENVESLEKEIKKALDLVANLDQDRILRRYLDVIRGTLRTNFFQKNSSGNPKLYLSFKLNPKAIPELPLPLPMYEIFVYSPRFEAIHLRAGKVARGGLRWSDRREDFRTEVLGLMKAQQVKNAVIVPAGAKGGFVIKTLPLDGNRDVLMAETIACYKNFIRGLLDITDNLVDNAIVNPKDVVHYDEDDPYLVVAADKGTATFSDIANGISKEYEFWLGDAFASGGSSGYDHKKMAITSRGVWESVKHHFQLLGINLNQPFTVVGIGDMSGDVFGNGMLLSKNIKLIAAYNHMHIFLDPAPDPQKSYEERKRLFHLPRSTWEDYNPEIISKGGGVYRRSLKYIMLSPEIQAALDFRKDVVEPNELIRALLKAPVDLIWNGGIGTYVKSATERNLEVGDRANDAIRINGLDLRSKAVGEGGNLGFTQLGRIEYELNGGKINTDFIDNSAGVDCSDHEVNIKILLNECITSGEMTEKQRNALLVEMTEEVAKLVLYDNYRQVRTITRAVSQSPDYLSLYIRFMADQERNGNLNRQLEFLPDEKTLMERKGNGVGLTRPEIAVLMAYSKILLKKEIVKSELVDDPYAIKYLGMAFPKKLLEQFSQKIQQHRLRREIIATQLSNTLVNDMGITFVYQIKDETGATSTAIAQAYSIMREVFNISWLLSAIDEWDEKMGPSIYIEDMELEMMLEAIKLIRRATRWLLRNQRPPYDITTTIQHYSHHVAELYEKLPELLVGVEKENFESKTTTLIAANVPEDIANMIASARYIYASLNIIKVATEYRSDINEVALIYFSLAERLELLWFREKINTYPVDTHWTVLARATFKDDLDAQERALTISVLRHKVKLKDVTAGINEWFKMHQPLIQRWQEVVTQLRSASVIEPAMLTVAIRELHELAEISGHDIHTQQ